MPWLSAEKYRLFPPTNGPMVRASSPCGGRSTLMTRAPRFGEDERAVGAREDAGQVDDDDAGERPAARASLMRGAQDAPARFALRCGADGARRPGALGREAREPRRPRRTAGAVPRRARATACRSAGRWTWRRAPVATRGSSPELGHRVVAVDVLGHRIDDPACDRRRATLRAYRWTSIVPASGPVPATPSWSSASSIVGCSRRRSTGCARAGSCCGRRSCASSVTSAIRATRTSCWSAASCGPAWALDARCSPNARGLVDEPAGRAFRSGIVVRRRR